MNTNKPKVLINRKYLKIYALNSREETKELKSRTLDREAPIKGKINFTSVRSHMLWAEEAESVKPVA